MFTSNKTIQLDEDPHCSIFNAAMRYVYILLFFICTLLANAQESESYSGTCLSYPVSKYKEVEKINSQKVYEQTIYWKKHKRLKIYAFGTLGLGICGTLVGLIGVVGISAYTYSNWKNDG